MCVVCPFSTPLTTVSRRFQHTQRSYSREKDKTKNLSQNLFLMMSYDRRLFRPFMNVQNRFLFIFTNSGVNSPHFS